MDPISNMLTQLKNAQMAGKDHVVLPFSKIKSKIAGILKEEGFVEDSEKRKKKVRKAELDYLEIKLKYDSDRRGAIGGIKIISKPSRHIYMGVKDIKPVRSGYGIAVLSTPKGVLSSKEARKQNVGGEILFEVWK